MTRLKISAEKALWLENIGLHDCAGFDSILMIDEACSNRSGWEARSMGSKRICIPGDGD